MNRKNAAWRLLNETQPLYLPATVFNRAWRHATPAQKDDLARRWPVLASRQDIRYQRAVIHFPTERDQP
jgi:hypothetical protein